LCIFLLSFLTIFMPIFVLQKWHQKYIFQYKWEKWENPKNIHMHKLVHLHH
jgi:hypothetical protein